MYNTILKITMFLLVLPFLVYGCGGTTVRYMNPSANFSYVNKVAVLPFSNFSEDKYAAEKVRNALTVELMSRHAFDVLEHGEVSKVFNFLREGSIEDARIVQVDKETMKLLGAKLGVQAIIMGSVNEYSAKGGGFANNVVSISVKMLDAESGTILWQANTSEVGSGTLRKMFGMEQVDMSILTNRVVKKILNTLM